jgi:hypothetical protein
MQIEITVKKSRGGGNIVNKGCVSMQVLYVQNNFVIHSVLLIDVFDMPQFCGRALNI